MNQKIIEYKLVMDTTPKGLTETINQMIKEGWIPTGGIFITQGPVVNHGTYTTQETMSHQAMVKLQIY